MSNTDRRHGDKTLLAACDLCQVERCDDCDVVHVHIGSVSLRLTMAAFMATCATLLEAARAAAVESKAPAFAPVAGLQ